MKVVDNRVEEKVQVTKSGDIIKISYKGEAEYYMIVTTAYSKYQLIGLFNGNRFNAGGDSIHEAVTQLKEWSDRNGESFEIIPRERFTLTIE